MTPRSLIKKIGKEVIIRRLQTISGNKRSFVTTATVDGAFQELDPQARPELDLTQDRAWVCYFNPDEVKNVNEGDLMVIDSKTYKVIEVTDKIYNTFSDHIEIILIEYDD